MGLVPVVGLEPTRGISPTDFESVPHIPTAPHTAAFCTRIAQNIVKSRTFLDLKKFTEQLLFAFGENSGENCAVKSTGKKRTGTNRTK